MRTYGRTLNRDGSYGPWVVVQTDANGFNDLVYFTTLCQAMKLNLNEDPFYANIGLPQIQSVQQGVPPDIYMAALQAYFAPFFASLQISRASNTNPPRYYAQAFTHQGAILNSNTVLAT
jgi:hypothetical protein